MSYFEHSSISNSDLRAFRIKMGLARQMPENMQAIYAFGTIFHKAILEPHKITDEEKKHPDYAMALKMRDRFWKDPLCRSFAMAKDFEREKEFYEPLKVDRYEINARCKMDGARTALKWCLELKGLRVSSYKAFLAAIDSLDYDQAVAHYQLTSKYEVTLMVGITKEKNPQLFKHIVKRGDDVYLWGEQKEIDTLKLLHEWSPDDVRIAA